MVLWFSALVSPYEGLGGRSSSLEASSIYKRKRNNTSQKLVVIDFFGQPRRVRDAFLEKGTVELGFEV